MVENFREFANSGVEVPLNLGGKTRYYDIDDHKVDALEDEWEIGIKWEYQSETISLFSKEKRTVGYPSPDLCFVLVLELAPASSGPPEYASIYNENGTLLRKVLPPKLISELAHRKKIEEGDGLGFPVWEAQKEGRPLFVIDVIFGKEYYERRELNLQTGEFGRCVSAGRY